MEHKRDTIKDIKRLFMEKGVLKSDILRSEIGLSWERSRLQKIISERLQKKSGTTEKPRINDSYTKLFHRIRGRLPYENIMLVDRNGSVVESHAASPGFQVPASFAEGVAGTTAFSISERTGKPFRVYFSEHYRSEFEGYISFSTILPRLGMADGEDMFILVFSKNDISSEGMLKIISECVKEVRRENSESNLKAQEADKSDVYPNEITYVELEKRYRKSKIHLAGISREIDKLRNELKDSLSSQKYIRIDGVSREACLACASFAIFSEGLLESEPVRSVMIDTGMDAIPNSYFSYNGNMIIFIDSLNMISRKVQRQLMSLLDTRRKSNCDTRVISIYHHGIADGWLIETIIDPLAALVNCPRYSYIPAAQRGNDIQFMIKESISWVSDEMEFESCAYASENFIKSLSRYGWPGDVEEMVNLMRFCVERIGDDRRLSDIYIPKVLRSGEYDGEQPAQDEGASDNSIKDMELKVISNVLSKNDNNISKSAMELGVSRSTLYRKMKLYGIDNGVSK